LEYATSPAVRSQDASTLLGALLAQPWSSDIAWEYVKAQWPMLIKTLNVFQALPDVVAAFGGFCSATRAAEVKQLLATHAMPAVSRAGQQAVERIEACVALDMRQSQPLGAWLARQ
jgi:hypothetical protein